MYSPQCKDPQQHLNQEVSYYYDRNYFQALQEKSEKQIIVTLLRRAPHKFTTDSYSVLVVKSRNSVVFVLKDNFSTSFAYQGMYYSIRCVTQSIILTIISCNIIKCHTTKKRPSFTCSTCPAVAKSTITITMSANTNSRLNTL